ncbi:MAG: hypothetical protein ORO03_00370 [Alphaproteobacteria bacterium]|nr:hypothetical protein [Alphaproteobacteria bacterium]
MTGSLPSDPEPVPPEFSRTVLVEQIGRETLVEEIAASAAELQALAERFDLISIESLTARVTLRRTSGNRVIHLSAEFRARCEQKSVVSLEPVATEVTDHCSCDFVIAREVEGDPAHRREIEFDALDEDCEWLTEPSIDIGEVIAQYFYLSLPSFPRRPGEEITGFNNSHFN